MTPTRRKKRIKSQDIGKAFAHPVRGEVLTALTERTASPTELASELGKAVNYLNYHFELLLDWELIELVRTRPRRGSTEHFYRATSRTLIDLESWEDLPRPLQEDNCGQVMQRTLEDFASAAKGGTLVARPDAYLGRTLLDLDEEGWEEASEKVIRIAAELLDVQSKSANRLAKSGAESIKVSASLLLFELPANGKSG